MTKQKNFRVTEKEQELLVGLKEEYGFPESGTLRAGIVLVHKLAAENPVEAARLVMRA